MFNSSAFQLVELWSNATVLQSCFVFFGFFRSFVSTRRSRGDDFHDGCGREAADTLLPDRLQFKRLLHMMNRTPVLTPVRLVHSLRTILVFMLALVPTPFEHSITKKVAN